MTGPSVEERARAACGSVAPVGLPDGAAVLNEVESYLSRFVAHPDEHARAAHVLWIAHCHLMHVWESTPRIAFLSAEPASGKSRALEVTELLVPDPVHAVSATPAYLFRKIGQAEDQLPTVLFDEVDTIYGPRAAGNEELRALLNSGYRRGAVAGRCVVRGKEVFTEELPSFCAVALAGLGTLPDTVLTRSVIIRMRRRAPHERVEPFRARVNGPEGQRIRDRLARWAAGVEVEWPTLPTEIQDRDADVWEALVAVADAAGSQWPHRARVAAVSLVAQSKEDGGASLGIRLLHDLRRVFGTEDQLPSAEILARLHSLDESPWADLKGKPLDSRGLSYRLRGYEVRPQTIRVGSVTPKGYRRCDLVDAWERYLPPISEKSATPATGATMAQPRGFSVADGEQCCGSERNTSPDPQRYNPHEYSEVADVSGVAANPDMGSSGDVPDERAQTCAASDDDFAEKIMARFQREAVR